MASLQKKLQLLDGEVRTFNYVAVNAGGQRVKGTVLAGSEPSATQQLQDDGLFPITVSVAKAVSMNMNISIGGSGPKMKIQQQSAFAKTFHQLIKAGISVPAALIALGREESALKKAMLNDIAEQVQSGSRLAEAMAAYPKCFDDVFCAYIAAGEASGTLTETTKRLAEMVTKRAELSAKIKQATAYPKMVGGAIFCLTAGIIQFLVPQYEGIYKSFNAPLPAPTKMLVTVSGMFPMIALIGGILMVSLIVWLKKVAKNPANGERLDGTRYRVPILGKLWHYQSLYRWATTLAGSLSAGVPLLTCLDLSAAASGSLWQKSLVPRFQETLRAGRKLSTELEQGSLTRLFPGNMRTMVSTGEAAGELDTMLSSIADAIDSEIDTIVAGLSAKMEVALLLVLGVVVGGLLMILYLPILNLATTVQKGLSK